MEQEHIRDRSYVKLKRNKNVESILTIGGKWKFRTVNIDSQNELFERGTFLMEKIYLSAKDISEILEVSLSKAYQIIRTLNAELAAENYLVLPGKIPIAYFKKRWYS